MDYETSNTIKCVKGVGTRVWDENFSYIIVAENETDLFAVLNNLLPDELSKKFKADKFRRVAIFHEGEPFKPSNEHCDC